MPVLLPAVAGHHGVGVDVPYNRYNPTSDLNVFQLQVGEMFGFTVVEIWGGNLGKPALYLIRGEYSRKSIRSTNVIKLGDLSVLGAEGRDPILGL